MVPLASLSNQFEAQVLGARLGAEGILWQLRGASSVYPFGSVEMLVDADDLTEARELLLADEVESVFAADDGDAADDEHGGLSTGRGAVSGTWSRIFALVAAATVLLAIAARLSSWIWL